MALYKYEVTQKKGLDADGNEYAMDGYFVKAKLDQADWGTATDTIAGTEEFNAKVTGSKINDVSALTITAGNFQVADTSNPAVTVTLDGSETSVADIMDKIAEACENLDLKVTSISEINDYASTQESFIVIESTGTKGTSDAITITAGTATLSEFGLTAGTTNGTKPDITVEVKKLLGGYVTTTSNVDNPALVETREYSYVPSIDPIESGWVRRTRVLSKGATAEEVNLGMVPATIDLPSTSYVETEFDDAVDTPITTFIDATDGNYLYEVQNVCTDFDTETQVCNASRYEPVELSAEDKTKNAAYLQAKTFKNQQACIAFGSEIIAEYNTEIVLAGVIQAGQDNTVRIALTDVNACLQAGALFAAMTEIDNITPSDPYLSSDRLTRFKNKIQAFLDAL